MKFAGRRSWLGPGLKPMAVALGTASLLLFAAASADSQPANPTPNQAATAPITDQKIDAAAHAMVQVASLRQSYEQKIAAAPDSEKGQLMTEAGKAMTKAVTDRGLSVAEYNAIVDRAKTDPDIRHKLVQHLPSGAQP